MCLALVLPTPLASADEEVQVDVDHFALAPADMWARAFAEVEGDLRWMVTLARAVGLGGEEADEAECAIIAPVGDSELSRLRALQFRQYAARELATLLSEAGHRSAEIEEWAGPGEDERRVRQRLE